MYRNRKQAKQSAHAESNCKRPRRVLVMVGNQQLLHAVSMHASENPVPQEEAGLQTASTGC